VTPPRARLDPEALPPEVLAEIAASRRTGLPPLPPPPDPADLPPGTLLCGFCLRPLEPHQKRADLDGVPLHGPCRHDVLQARLEGEHPRIASTVEIHAREDFL
jgi:hypothetical protein